MASPDLVVRQLTAQRSMCHETMELPQALWAKEVSQPFVDPIELTKTRLEMM